MTDVDDKAQREHVADALDAALEGYDTLLVTDHAPLLQRAGEMAGPM